MNDAIRELNPSELDLVKEFTYEAIFQRDEQNPIGRDVLEVPEVKVFYENFGKKTDACLVAEVEGKIVGAVWTRIL